MVPFRLPCRPVETRQLSGSSSTIKHQAVYSSTRHFLPCNFAGDPNSNWAWFEKQKSAYANINLRFTAGDLHDTWGAPGTLDSTLVGTRFREMGPSVIQKGYKIEEASDFWNLYESDIQLAADLGKAQIGQSTMCAFNLTTAADLVCSFGHTAMFDQVSHS